MTFGEVDGATILSRDDSCVKICPTSCSCTCRMMVAYFPLLERQINYEPSDVAASLNVNTLLTK